jgi:hypothetical protein
VQKLPQIIATVEHAVDLRAVFGSLLLGWAINENAAASISHQKKTPAFCARVLGFASTAESSVR